MTVEEQKVEMTSDEEAANTEVLAPVESVEVQADVVEEAPETDTEDCESESSPEDEALVNPNFHWYVVHTYSGYENRAKASLDERIIQFGLEELFGEVLIPTENVVELSPLSIPHAVVRTGFRYKPSDWIHDFCNIAK